MSSENTQAVVSTQEASSPRGPDTPTDYIPGLYTLGATYDVLNGKYADSKSALQQIIDWDKSSSFFFAQLCIPANELINRRLSSAAVW